MNKQKITYGVYHLIEWNAQLRMGKAIVKVSFTGGSTTSQGVTPATFTTADPIVQLAIEQSQDFKAGKIKVVRRTQLKGEITIERNPPKLLDARHPEFKEGLPNETDTTDASPEDETEEIAPNGEEMSAETDDPEEVPVSEATPTAESESTSDTRIAVEFSVNDDAKDYLEENFGAKRSTLRTRADILAFAEAHNVDIKFI